MRGLVGEGMTMKTDWCWACGHEHPMLNDQEFDAVWRAYQAALEGESNRQHAKKMDTGGTPRERLLKHQDHPRPALPAGVNSRQLRYHPLRDAYERVTGSKFEGDDPKVILHYRASFYGPPCPHCGRLLRNPKARQCFECGTDWHDPEKVVCDKGGTEEPRGSAGPQP